MPPWTAIEEEFEPPHTEVLPKDYGIFETEGAGGPDAAIQ